MTEMTEEHKRHPGWAASGCPLRITVNAVAAAPHASGFACADTGGRCTPGAACADRVEEYEEYWANKETQDD